MAFSKGTKCTVLPQKQNFCKAVKCRLDCRPDLTYGFCYNIAFLCVYHPPSPMFMSFTHICEIRMEKYKTDGKVLLEKLFLL